MRVLPYKKITSLPGYCRPLYEFIFAAIDIPVDIDSV
jgi:hypothetical protein